MRLPIQTKKGTTMAELDFLQPGYQRRKAEHILGVEKRDKADRDERAEKSLRSAVLHKRVHLVCLCVSIPAVIVIIVRNLIELCF